MATHFYSCMSTVTRKNGFRYAGAIEAAYLIDEMDVEVIADGLHCPPPLLKLIYKIKGSRHTALITDAMRAAGMPPGESILGNRHHGLKVIVEDGVAKLLDRSSFAGSVATADQLVRTMIHMAEVPLMEAVRMITETPARILGIQDRKGALVQGKDADIVIFDKTSQSPKNDRPRKNYFTVKIKSTRAARAMTMKELLINQMRVRISGSRTELGKDAADIFSKKLSDLLGKKQYVNVIFAAAPRKTNSISVVKERASCLEPHPSAFHMDEYIGLDQEAPTGFWKFPAAKIMGKPPLSRGPLLAGECGGSADRMQAVCGFAFKPSTGYCLLGNRGERTFGIQRSPRG